MKRNSFFAVLGCATLLAFAMPASATLTLHVDDSGANTQTASNCANPCSIIGAFGVFNVVVSTGLDFSTPGSPSIDLALNAGSTGAGTLRSWFSISDLDIGAGAHTLQLAGSITNNQAAGVTWRICADDGNVVGGTQQCSAVTVAPSGLSFLSLAANLTGTYSLTIFEFWAPTSATAGLSLDGNLHTAPEPATLAIIGLGLAGLGFARRKQA